MGIVRANEMKPDLSDPGVSALRIVTSEQVKTMTAGVATFTPGAAILLHTHSCEETVIGLEGQTAGFIKGEKIVLGKYDTIITDPEIPHYVANETDRPMVITYFYHTANPARDLAAGYKSPL